MHILPSTDVMDPKAIYSIFAFNVVTSVITVLTNYCFILGILRNKSLITPTNLLIISLSCSDFLVGLIAQPLTCAFLLVDSTHPWSYRLAYATFLSLGTFCGASGLCLPLISLDRYLRVKKLHRYMYYVTRKRVLIALLVLWLNAFGIAFLPLYGLELKYFYCILLVYLVVISIIMAAAYSYITRVSVRSRNKVFASSTARRSVAFFSAALQNRTSIPTDETRQYSNIVFARQMRLSITVALLVFVLIISWLPAFIVSLVWSLDIDKMNLSRTLVTLHYLTMTFGYACSCVNPLLYCYQIKEVRKAATEVFWLTLRCCHRKN